MTDEHDKRAREWLHEHYSGQSFGDFSKTGPKLGALLRATAERARAEGKAEGAREERAAVVAWLRGPSCCLSTEADLVERGEHAASAPAAIPLDPLRLAAESARTGGLMTARAWSPPTSSERLAIEDARDNIVEAACIFVEDAVGGYGGNVWRDTEDGRRLIVAVQRLAGLLAPRRPSPLSAEERERRKPPPPESLVGALQDRIHPTSGPLIKAKPLGPAASAEKRCLRCVEGLVCKAHQVAPCHGSCFDTMDCPDCGGTGKRKR